MDWKAYERHPLSAEYEDIKGKPWERFVENLKLHGIINDRKVMLWEGKVVDGWQLYRGCIEADLEPEFEEVVLKEGMTIEEWVTTQQDFRRHETQKAAMKRADERRERVAASRAEGKSVRTIAEQEGVAVGTVLRDLEKTTVPPGTSAPDLQNKAKTNSQTTTPNIANGKPNKKSNKIEEKEEGLTDSLDRPVPPGLEGVFTRAEEFREVVNQLNAINRKLKDLAEHFADMRLQSMQIDLKNLKETVRFDMPYAVCPVCEGIAKTRKANCACKQKGWLVEGAYKNLPAEYRA